MVLGFFPKMLLANFVCKDTHTHRGRRKGGGLGGGKVGSSGELREGCGLGMLQSQG